MKTPVKSVRKATCPASIQIAGLQRTSWLRAISCLQFGHCGLKTDLHSTLLLVSCLADEHFKAPILSVQYICLHGWLQVTEFCRYNAITFCFIPKSNALALSCESHCTSSHSLPCYANAENERLPSCFGDPSHRNSSCRSVRILVDTYSTRRVAGSSQRNTTGLNQAWLSRILLKPIHMSVRLVGGKETAVSMT